ncbi:unnamed protein product [Urochloa humidicola]
MKHKTGLYLEPNQRTKEKNQTSNQPQQQILCFYRWPCPSAHRHTICNTEVWNEGREWIEDPCPTGNTTAPRRLAACAAAAAAEGDEERKKNEKTRVVEWASMFYTQRRYM